jgi:nicotinamidase-related amidase
MMMPFDRLTSAQAGLVVIDLQEKLVPLIPDRELVLANTIRLITAAQVLGIPVWATEQYPKGLGPLVSSVAKLLPHRSEKTTFHCCVVPELLEQLHGRGTQHLTLAGIETHVCIAQSALELMGMGFRVQVPADAVGSRARIDWEFALRRLERAGAVVTTTEAALFEWVERSDHPQFKAISKLVKDFVPPTAK